MGLGNWALAKLPEYEYVREINLKHTIDSGAAALSEVVSHAAPGHYLQGAICNNNSLTHARQWTFRLASRQTTVGSSHGGASRANIVVNVRCRITGAPAVAATLAFKAARQLNAGADTSIGSGGVGELNLTASVDLKDVAANTWVTRQFTIDGTDLNAGDNLWASIQAVMNDTGGTGGGRLEIDSIWSSGWQHG